MKKQNFLPILLGFILAIGLSSCEDKVIQEVTYEANVPVYMSYDELYGSIEYSKTSEILENPGKIYYYKNFLFIGERTKGVHIFDNANPRSPQKVGFLNIPGNNDIAIRGNHLYADCFTDLLVFSLGDLENMEMVKRIEGVFEYTIPEYDYAYPLAEIDESKGVVIGFILETITEVRDVNQQYYPMYYPVEGDLMFASTSSEASFGGGFSGDNGAARNVGGASEGIGGSFARFMVVDEVLYVISNQNEVSFFDIQDESNPTAAGKFEPGWNIETLFYNEDHLFIGSNSGMFIYDITNRTDPNYISQFLHADACDPVVISEDVAYITLRSGGTRCPGWSDQMDVVDIQNIEQPTLLKTYPMTNPHGLGVDADAELVFVCDGSDGLKVYNNSNLLNIDGNMIHHKTGLSTYDVIALDGVLFLIAEDGLYQYDYFNPSDLNELSVIRIGE